MKQEYDFSSATRGRFYRPHADLAAPVHLDPAIRTWLASYAKSKGTTPSELVIELLRKDTEAIEATK